MSFVKYLQFLLWSLIPQEHNTSFEDSGTKFIKLALIMLKRNALVVLDDKTN